MQVKLIYFTPNPVKVVERAASTCYISTIQTPGIIMEKCYKSGHHSVFEFVDFIFEIKGVSRSLLAQLTRHRMASYAVESQRYVDMQDFDFIIPAFIQENEKAKKEYLQYMGYVNDVYSYLIEQGVPKEDARMILPNACCTQITMKINLRSLFNFMNLRLCERAQAEIRTLAKLMKEEIVKAEPGLKDYLVPKCEAHNPYVFCTESNSCGRH